MNQIENVLATNESMNAYCHETIGQDFARRSIVVSQTPRGYFDLCELLDQITTDHEAGIFKRILFDKLVQHPQARIVGVTCTCFLKGQERIARTLIRSRSRRPERSVTVRQAFSDPNEVSISANLIVRPQKYWEIERRLFPDLCRR